MAKPRPLTTLHITRRGGASYYTTRPAEDWQSILLDVVTILRREYRLSDMDIIDTIEDFGPDALDIKAAYADVESRVTGGRLLNPKRKKERIVKTENTDEGTGLSRGENKKAKASAKRSR